MRRAVLSATLLLVAAVSFLIVSGGTSAQSTGVSVTTTTESQFPDGILFHVSIASPVDIVEARVRFRVLGEQVTRNAPLEFTPSPNVESSLLVRTDTLARYIPPGAEIEYSVETTDANGGRSESAPRRFVLLDPRHEWSRLDADGAYLLYYGGQEGRARRALEAAQKALTDMGALMGVAETDTLRLVMYNSIGHMRRALPPRSQVQEETLVTEGISIGDTGVVMLLGSNPEVEGVAAHETVHFLMRFAVGRGARSVPAWLNEGLAEYANPFPSDTFARVLLRRTASNTLLPLTSLTIPPGKPEDTLLMYGQGLSVVTYMIDAYGEAPLQDLLRRLGDGEPIDDALTAAYGLDRVALDQAWRSSVGALPLEATPSRSALPTPIPRPTLVPFGVGGTPPPEPTRPRPSPTQATTAQEQASGGCTRAESGATDAAVIASVLLLGLLARRRKP